MKESQLQKKVIEDLENDSFGSKITVCISGKDFKKNNCFEADSIISDLYQSNVNTIVESMKNQDFQIINGKPIKNIAMGKDWLYTDILIQGIENSKYYVIELKISKKTGRETVTELMAYRHEIKNHLPFISNEDVVLVIVSLEYSSLLKHAVSSLLLDNIPVLCLSPKVIEGEIVSYMVEDILSWDEGGTKKINKKMFEGHSIYLFSNHDEQEVGKDEIDKDRMFAVEYYKAEANMTNTNGICVIWDANHSPNFISNRSSDYAISFFKINPYCIAYANLIGENDVLSKFIVENIYDRDNLTSSGLEIDQPINRLENVLSKKYWPQYGEFATFYQYEEIILDRSRPIYFDAWGRLGQEIKNIYSDNYETLFKGKSYTDPCVFMKIFNYLFEEYPFYNGFGNGESFNFGVYIKFLETLLKDYLNNSSTELWNQVEKVWSVLFCSFFRHPNLRLNNQIPSIEKDSINDSISFFNEVVKYKVYNDFTNEGKQAFEMGYRYSHIFIDYYGQTVCIDDLDDVVFHNGVPARLKKYFFINFKELLSQMKVNKGINNKHLGTVGHILNHCSFAFTNGKDELISTISILDISTLCYESIDRFIVENEMRNLLNFNS